MDELGAFLHDGDVSGVVHVEYAVEAEALEGGDHLALDVGADRHAELFAELYADGGSGTDDDVLGGISKRVPDLLGVVALLKSTCGANGDALAAVDAAGFRKTHLESGCDVGLETAPVGADDGSMLVVFADGDAAAAEDALAVVADEVDRGIVNIGLQLFAELILVRIALIFLGKGLQLAVGAADAAEAVHPVVGEQQLEGLFTGIAKLGGVGLDLHALRDLLKTCDGVAPCALDLDDADTAGADRVDVLEVAKGGDADAGLFSCLQNGVIRRNLNVHAVNLHVDHIHIGSPYFLTIALNLQVSMQAPHLMHLVVSIVWGSLTFPEIAPTGHLRAQAVQPRHTSGWM